MDGNMNRTLDKATYMTLMQNYLSNGYSVGEARLAIGNNNGLWRSIRTARRYAQSLHPCETESPIDDIITAVQLELKGPARNMGADAIWQRLRLSSTIKAKRQTIRDVIEAIFPGRAKSMKHNSLKRRVYKVKGPNHIWHVDGNDKIKPFGFCISGCMDGFSRKLIWLKVERTNKDPHLICTFFLEAVKHFNLVPRVVRMDRGTENVHIANVQRLLRSEHSDSLAPSAVMFGSSTHNQRIERFWSYLRRVLLNEYMNLFKDYLDLGVIDSSNTTHMECLSFCFMPVIRSELNSVLLSWNRHRVRQMKHAGCPSGVPDALFNDPEIVGFEKQGTEVDDGVLDRCYQLHQTELPDCNPVFAEWAFQQLIANDLQEPSSVSDAMSLFSKLIIEVHKIEL